MTPLIALSVLAAFHQAAVKPQVTSFPPGFSLVAPAPVKRADSEPGTPKGARYWSAATAEGGFAIYVQTLSEAEVASTPPDQVLAAMAAGLIQSGRIESQRDLVLNGWPGIEVEYSEATLKGRFRGYAVGKNLFGAVALWSKDAKEPNAVKPYLDSMSMSAKLGRGPQKKAGPDLGLYKLEGAGMSVKLPALPVRSETHFGPRQILMIRFASRYGNRSFVAMYADLPEEPGQEIAGHEREILDAVTAEMIEASKGSARQDRVMTRGSVEVLSTTAQIAPNGSLRIDSFFKGKRLYSLLAVGPTGYATSDEVKEIFDSIGD